MHQSGKTLFQFLNLVNMISSPPITPEQKDSFELAGLLETNKPRVVAISGRVGSDTSIDCQGLKAAVVVETVLGDVQIDRVLPIGKYLTVIAEARKDDSGAISIQFPPTGYFVFSGSLEAEIARLEESVSCSKTGSGVLAVLGVGFIVVGVLSIIFRPTVMPSLGVSELLAAAAAAERLD
ncbi:hypothetical protein Tsubulata_037437 [Turnera subulata]|uniref:RING-type E3 ubiquitin transferase n=1 Tax=Turnera subulata TaxID=218843 RepID=A0A9Q0FF14_9ROSI|nr:hypothetical protein Tsubulata_037437 [Turnera subulata]